MVVMTDIKWDISVEHGTYSEAYIFQQLIGRGLLCRVVRCIGESPGVLSQPTPRLSEKHTTSPKQVSMRYH